MFANPDPDNDGDPNHTRFEPFDIYKLLGLCLIAWAVVLSVGIGRLYVS